MSEGLRIAAVLTGILLMIIDFRAFVYRKISEGIAMCWCFIAAMFILLGAVPGLSDWSRMIPKEAVPALAFVTFGVLLAGFYLSCVLAQLLRKNQELAMHVSLLNQENESILNELKEMRSHENTVCH